MRHLTRKQKTEGAGGGRQGEDEKITRTAPLNSRLTILRIFLFSARSLFSLITLSSLPLFPPSSPSPLVLLPLRLLLLTPPVRIKVCIRCEGFFESRVVLRDSSRRSSSVEAEGQVASCYRVLPTCNQMSEERKNSEEIREIVQSQEKWGVERKENEERGGRRGDGGGEVTLA